MKKPNRPLLATIFIICLLFIFITGFLLGKTAHSPSQPSNGEGGPCTMEAKICPNGTAVGRHGKNCEFPECPEDPPAKQI